LLLILLYFKDAIGLNTKEFRESILILKNYSELPFIQQKNPGFSTDGYCPGLLLFFKTSINN